MRKDDIQMFKGKAFRLNDQKPWGELLLFFSHFGQG